MQDGSPSWGGNLAGMVQDFDWALAALDEIDDETVDVERTSNAEGLIRASCRAKTGVTLENAGAAVRGAWV